MSQYFGGQQADPQGVLIKDDSTGFAGFGRNSVTATSIISETIWGLALPEHWCNSGGNPLFAFMTNPLMVDYRDESTFSDSLGIVGAGPIGGYTGSFVVTNADGFRYVVCPMVDGFTWQGFKVDGNLNITKIPCQDMDCASQSATTRRTGRTTTSAWARARHRSGNPTTTPPG